MDKVIWVDESDNQLGIITREKAHAEGLLHRIAVVYLTNGKGELLVQERALDGHLDHSCAGHVDPGESYLDAAQRELREELGLKDVSLTDIGFSRSLDEGNFNGVSFNNQHQFRVFVTEAEPVRLEPTEVRRVFWSPPADVLKDMADHPTKYTNGFKASLQVFLKHTNP